MIPSTHRFESIRKELAGEKRVFGMHIHSIHWVNFREGRVAGWVWNHPDEGDLLEAHTTSGRTWVLQFVKVEICRDPNDMFFGTVHMLGYADEINKMGQLPTKLIPPPGGG